MVVTTRTLVNRRGRHVTYELAILGIVVNHYGLNA